MLEEAIRNYDKVHPAEVALSMLSFLQSELPAGGTAAETRFLNLFLPLCDCIFGPILEPPADSNYRHKDGGWLSTQNSWTRTIPLSMHTSATTSSSPRNSMSHSSSKLHLSTSSSNSLDSDPVVRLLGTSGPPTTNRETLPMTLIEAISKESENRPSVTFPFLFYALPQPLQVAWLDLIKQRTGIMMMGNQSLLSPAKVDDSLSCTKNDIRLFGHLLRKGLDEQKQLQVVTRKTRYQYSKPLDDQNEQEEKQLQQQQKQFLSPQPYNGPVSSAQITSIGVSNSPNPTTNEKIPKSPEALLSMLEYYLFLFLRFPLSSPDRGNSGSSRSSVSGVNVHRIQSTVGTGSSNSSSSRMVREAFGETLYYHIFRRYMRHFLPYEISYNRRTIAMSGEGQPIESELYLRLMIAMWLESRSRLSATALVVDSMLERRRHRTGSMDNDLSSSSLLLDLDASYDLTQTLQKYDPLPTLVHKCLRTLIIHVILDPALEQNGLDYSNRGISSTPNEKWCMSTCMTILQQPIYNYIRTTFRFAPIHSSSESSFYGALNIWLIWLEPWNVSQAHNTPFSAKNATQHILGSIGSKDSNKMVLTQRTLTIPRPNQPSKYVASKWESYIAANVYMYAVPLAIFIRRARELDFSVNKFDRSMEIVQRVFRVFTPSVVDAVSRCLDIAQHLDNSNLLVQYHSENLGPFAPPSGLMSLFSLKTDMQSLLEEVYMHHAKKVLELDTFDWLMGKVEGLFGAGIVSGEEKTLETLLERAKVITRCPIDCNILPRRGKSISTSMLNNASTTSGVPTRVKDGELTNFGRAQLLSGCIRLNPDDVRFSGDRMRAKVQSYEIPILVDSTVLVSDILNQHLGFTRVDDYSRADKEMHKQHYNIVRVCRN